MREEEAKLSDIMVGFVDLDEDPNSIPLPAAAQNTDDDDDADVEDTGPDPEEAEKRFVKIERTFNRAMACIGKDDVKGYERNMSRAVSELMEIKLLPLFIDKLSANLKDIINRIRTNERTILDICVKQAQMPRKTFIETFKANETNLKWIDNHLKSGEKYSKTLEACKEEILRYQKRLKNIEKISNLSIFFRRFW